MSARQSCKVTEPSMADHCDTCNTDIGRPDRVETKFTVDGWSTVGCSWDCAERAARMRRG